MNAKRTPRIAPILLATAIALGVALPAAAESAAELLEKGIYTEQTVGDLAAAIEIYTRVVENTEANRPHAAQAQFRLGWRADLRYDPTADLYPSPRRASFASPSSVRLRREGRRSLGNR